MVSLPVVPLTAIKMIWVDLGRISKSSVIVFLFPARFFLIVHPHVFSISPPYIWEYSRQNTLFQSNNKKKLRPILAIFIRPVPIFMNLSEKVLKRRVKFCVAPELISHLVASDRGRYDDPAAAASGTRDRNRRPASLSFRVIYGQRLALNRKRRPWWEMRRRWIGRKSENVGKNCIGATVSLITFFCEKNWSMRLFLHLRDFRFNLFILQMWRVFKILLLILKNEWNE